MKKFKSILLIFLLLVFFPLNYIFTQNIIFEKNFTLKRWTKKEGLPSNQILNSLLSSEGFIYLSTENGLCRYDGKVFKIYNASTINEFTSNAVIRLYENKNGKLFLSVSSQGVLIKEGDHFKIISESEGLSLNHPSSILEDDEGNLYVGTYGAGINIIKDGKINCLNTGNGLLSNSVLYLYKDKSNKIWIGSKLESVQYLKDGKLFNLSTSLKNKNIVIKQIIEAGNDILFATQKGIFVLSGDKIDENKKFDYFKNKNITAVAYDSLDRLWIAIEYGGLYFVKNSKIHKVELPELSNKIIINHINPTWIGLLLSTDDGLIKLNEKKLEVIFTQDEVENSNIRSVYQVNDQEVLFSNNRSVYRYNWFSKKVIQVKSDFKKVRIFAYEKLDGNKFLLGTFQNGVLLYENGILKEYSKIKNLKSNFVRSIKKLDENTLIIGTNGAGVAIANQDSIKYLNKNNGLVDNFIGCITIDNQQNIWVGTSGGGISILNKNGEIIQNITEKDGLSSGIVNSIAQDKEGTIWIGTSVAGICRFKNNKIIRINKSSGLISNNIKKLLYDGNEYLWITTDNGILKIKIDELNNFAENKTSLLKYDYINQSDGLLTEEFNAVADNAGCITNNGYFFAPSKNGLVIIDTKQNFKKDEKIKIYCDEIIVNNKKIKNSNELTSLPPNTETINLKFGAISFLNIENVAFNYKIEGINKDWNYIGPQRELLLTKLHPGKYSISLFAITSTGIKSNIISIPFTIKPYFWQTNEFLIITITSSVLILFLSIKTYIRIRYKRKLKKLEFENLLINERMRISKDIHDEVGAELTILSLMVDRISNFFEFNKENINFNTLQEKIHSLSQLMDEIVWTVNPKYDTLESTILYSINFANELFANSNMELHIEIPSNIPDVKISADVRHNLLLALKEVMNNSIKHSKGKNFWFYVSLDSQSVCFELKDDGIGFNTEDINQFSNGIKDVKQRIEKISGLLEIKGNHPLGTSVIIKYDFENNIIV